MDVRNTAWHNRFGWLARALPCVIISMGALLRLIGYLQNRSLRLDEAKLALNIIDRPFSELHLPLAYNQGAPYGFLLLEKLAVACLGRSEYAFRLVPLCAGIAGLILAWRMARPALGAREGLLATCFLAASPCLVRFSSEVKQYSTDAFVALLILTVVLGSIGNRIDHKKACWLGLAGAAAIWFSHPSVLMLAPAGVVMGLAAVRSGDRRQVVLVGLAGVTWITSFCVCYFLTMRSLTSNGALLRYWSDAFMPLPPTSPSHLAWFPVSLKEMLHYPGGLRQPWLGLAAASVGSVIAWRRNRQLLSVLLLPLPTAMIVSGLCLYPFGGRMLFYLVPSAMMLMAAGLGWIGKQKGRAGGIASFVVFAWLMLGPAKESLQDVFLPYVNTDIRGGLRYVVENRAADDLLYVHRNAMVGYLFYAETVGLAGMPVIHGTTDAEDAAAYRRQLESLSGYRRTWIIITKGAIRKSDEFSQEESFVLSVLADIGRVEIAYRASGIKIYIFEPRGSLNDGRTGPPEQGDDPATDPEKGGVGGYEPH